MDINKLNKAIEEMVNNSNSGILSVAVYNVEDDLVITGNNINYQIASVSNNLFKSFFENLKMFNFADNLNNSALVFEDKTFYTGKLDKEFNFTVVLDSSKIELGYFKGILLKNFLKSI